MAEAYSQTYYRSPAEWHFSSGGALPAARPVLGGEDVTGESLFIGRAIQEGDTIPGKIVPSHGCCYVSYDGKEHAHSNYQVLTNPHGFQLVWVPTGGGSVPFGALQGGRQSDGQQLFIGRSWHNGSLVIGKVHPEHGVLYVPFGGDEVPISDYEVLVCKEVQF